MLQKSSHFGPKNNGSLSSKRQSVGVWAGKLTFIRGMSLCKVLFKDHIAVFCETIFACELANPAIFCAAKRQRLLSSALSLYKRPHSRFLWNMNQWGEAPSTHSQSKHAFPGNLSRWTGSTSSLHFARTRSFCGLKYPSTAQIFSSVIKNLSKIFTFLCRITCNDQSSAFRSDISFLKI